MLLVGLDEAPVVAVEALELVVFVVCEPEDADELVVDGIELDDGRDVAAVDVVEPDVVEALDPEEEFWVELDAEDEELVPDEVEELRTELLVPDEV